VIETGSVIESESVQLLLKPPFNKSITYTVASNHKYTLITDVFEILTDAERQHYNVESGVVEYSKLKDSVPKRLQ